VSNEICKKKQNSNKKEISIAVFSIKIKEQTKSKKKRHNSGKFAVSLKILQNSLYNNSRIQTISAKTKYNDGPTRPEQTWPYFAI